MDSRDEWSREAVSRSEALFGHEGVERLRRSRVILFGVGGVGGYVLEALARSGVGSIDLVDDDTVSVSNLNRQILATRESVGRPKVEVAAERVRSIFPEIRVTAHRCFFLPEKAGEFDFASYDYVIDAIDTVAGKISIIAAAVEAGTRVISCMGAGNKLDPSAFRVADLSKTSVCPLARVMRTELKKRGILHLPVVYSEEIPRQGMTLEAEDSSVATGADRAERPGKPKNRVPGSCAFVPAAAGMVLAGRVICDLAGLEQNEK